VHGPAPNRAYDPQSIIGTQDAGNAADYLGVTVGETTLSCYNGRMYDKKAASKIYSTETRRLRHELSDLHAGTECLFCGYKDRLVTHRKDGQPHKPFHMMGRAEYKIHLESGEYARVCFHCHKGVHWAMKHLSLTWEEITRA